MNAIAIDRYDNSNNLMYLPNVIVGGDDTYQAYMEHLGDLVFKVVSTKIVTFPDKFSNEWLKGNTFYWVWFGIGQDSNGNDIENDVAVVLQADYNEDGTFTVTGLLNSTSGTDKFNVNENGELYTDNPSNFSRICGKTEQYLITEYYENNSLDNIDLLFFDKDDALNTARNLGTSIPGCESLVMNID
jgi:hypothetical protein